MAVIVSNIFFFNDTATTEIYTLSLHDALPICTGGGSSPRTTTSETAKRPPGFSTRNASARTFRVLKRSEEHTSELQSQSNLVCRLLLEKKKNKSAVLHSTTRTHSDIHFWPSHR